MRLVGKDPNGNREELPMPLSFEFSSGLDTPVDRLELVFLYGKGTKNRLFEVSLYDDTGEALFQGIVDEHIIETSGEGQRVIVKCRSRAALLMDNEAKPGTYYRITLQELFNRHVAPYGFELARRDSTAQYNFVIPKGCSQWEVLCLFCRKMSGTTPFITPDKLVWTYFRYGKAHHLISNTSGGGIRFLRSQVRYKRYGVISRIYLQNNQGVYKTHVDSFPAAVHGVACVRDHSPPSEMVNDPLTSAQKKLDESMREILTIQAVLPGFLPMRKGDKATLEQEGKRYEDLVVGDVSVTYNPTSPITTVVLYHSNYLKNL